MFFIGQNHIMRQLSFLLPELYSNKSHGANFLFRGRSGYGKTTMAIKVAEYLANGKNFELYLADTEEFRLQKRVIFIDEVHRMRTHEILYPVMDEKIHVFIFATNHDGILPEAFSNRCFEYIFDEYSTDELLLIARESTTFSAPDEAYEKIIEAGNRNPRLIKSLVDRIGSYFRNSAENSYTANYDEILEGVFQIKDGLDTLARRYVEILRDVGGTASLSLLKNILNVDEETIRNTVEPVLLRKGLVKITSKGRKIPYDS